MYKCYESEKVNKNVHCILYVGFFCMCREQPLITLFPSYMCLNL